MVNPRMVQKAIKYGPLIVGAAQKYGPTVVQEARKHAPGIVEEVERRTGRRPDDTGATRMSDATPRSTDSLVDRTPLGPTVARRRATQHARTVVDGSYLQTFLHSRPVFVVFSGDTPVATHPHVDVAFSELLRHADLSARKRVRPQATPRPYEGQGSEQGEPGQPGPRPDDEPLEGTIHTP
ncbi:hypothetical protein SAMN05445756_0979 [Kytococcus aerolatus]|uniref:Uncharacterized protein n=1 Tax=Kytococcus aerolatus TaxID=592308 RepID=A0A212TCN7_9MICO|nr:hypothetical protein [Kytococcus aerolatus]SNC63789.1 hypothetical protein SAMN05445756_0979 [Kytococcus aerolatus]